MNKIFTSITLSCVALAVLVGCASNQQPLTEQSAGEKLDALSCELGNKEGSINQEDIDKFIAFKSVLSEQGQDIPDIDTILNASDDVIAALETIEGSPLPDGISNILKTSC
jgi:hypothetical protein